MASLIALLRRARIALRRPWLRVTVPGLRLGEGVTVADDVVLLASDGGEIILGDRCSLSRGVTVMARGGRVEIGNDTFVGSWSTLVARQEINIGSECLVAERVTIRDQDHEIHGDPAVPIYLAGFSVAPIRIGRGVWIGAGAAVLKGVSIGDGCVIAANAVVSKQTGSFEIHGGVPARCIGKRGERPA